MNCLIDTHAFLWLISDDRRLSARAKEVFLSENVGLYFSAASYWEICIKISLDKLKLAPDWQAVIDREILRNTIYWLPIEKQHAQNVVTLPWHHRDPFDRLLVAQAACEDLTILTADTNLGLYPVPTIW